MLGSKIAIKGWLYKEASMEIYYENDRIKVVKNESGKYDMYDNKFGGRKTWHNGTKEQIDEKIQAILRKRSRRK